MKSIILPLILIWELVGKLYFNEFSTSTLRRNKGWIFLDRMSVGEGQVDVNFQASIISAKIPEGQTYQLELAIIPDNLWEQQAAFKCENPRRQSSPNVQDKTLQQQQMFIQFSEEKGLKGNQAFSFTISSSRTYHFVLRDCQKKLVNQYFNRQSKLKVQLSIKNNGQEHGEDQEAYSFLLPFSLVGTALMVYFSRGKKEELEIVEENTDWAKLLMHIALVINFLALLFFYIGFLIYLYIGRFYGFFDFIYLLLHSVSEALVTGLLVFIAFGWTVTFIKTTDFDLYVPLVGMLGIINVILTLLTKINDGDHNKYHMHDTIPSYLLLAFRIISLLVFVLGIFLTLKTNKKNERISEFMIKIGIAGTIYFLSLPVMIFGCRVVEIASRKWIVFAGQEILKNVINFWFTWMVSSKKSAYRQVSQGHKSFMEEGNKLL